MNHRALRIHVGITGKPPPACQTPCFSRLQKPDLAHFLLPSTSHPNQRSKACPGEASRSRTILTDLSGPICGPANPSLHPFRFPDGPLRRDVIYHVTAVQRSKDGNQALHLTGMRVFWGPEEIPWNSTRFRKVDALKGHVPRKRRRKHPTPAIHSAASISLNL